MRIEEEKVGGILVVRPLEKRIDAASTPEFKGLMAERIASGNRAILLDLAEVDFIDSSGLGSIVSVLKTLKENGDLTICGLRETVASLFRLTRMDHVFRIFRDRSEALASIQQP